MSPEPKPATVSHPDFCISLPWVAPVPLVHPVFHAPCGSHSPITSSSILCKSYHCMKRKFKLPVQAHRSLYDAASAHLSRRQPHGSSFCFLNALRLLLPQDLFIRIASANNFLPPDIHLLGSRLSFRSWLKCLLFKNITVTTQSEVAPHPSLCPACSSPVF